MKGNVRRGIIGRGAARAGEKINGVRRGWQEFRALSGRERAVRIKDMLLEVNSQLKTANQDLKLANKIKDSYVFSYMELAITYLQKLEDSRREVRAIAKNEGLEAVIKILRSPSYIYEEYKHYYTVFDEAFLGIFPDFREFFQNNLEIILAFCYTIMYNVSAWAKRPMTKSKPHTR